MYLNNLALRLGDNYARKGEEADLDNSLGVVRDAINLSPEDSASPSSLIFSRTIRQDSSFCPTESALQAAATSNQPPLVKVSRAISQAGGLLDSCYRDRDPRIPKGLDQFEKNTPPRAAAALRKYLAHGAPINRTNVFTNAKKDGYVTLTLKCLVF